MWAGAGGWGLALAQFPSAERGGLWGPSVHGCVAGNRALEMSSPSLVQVPLPPWGPVLLPGAVSSRARPLAVHTLGQVVQVPAEE